MALWSGNIEASQGHVDTQSIPPSPWPPTNLTVSPGLHNTDTPGIKVPRDTLLVPDSQVRPKWLNVDCYSRALFLEYPGADDRGGVDKDGENFTLLLRELRAAIKAQPIDYVVSFTTPTSYWYLRHFDLKAVAPDAFNWHPSTVNLTALEKTIIQKDGGEYKCLTGGSRRSIRGSRAGAGAGSGSGPPAPPTGQSSSIRHICWGNAWCHTDHSSSCPIPRGDAQTRHHYNLTCLSDGSRFCNNVAAAFSVSLDPDTAALPGGLPAGGDYGGYSISDPCDKCLVSLLRFQAASPYYNGPELQESSLYQSKTSSCGINSMPLTTTPLVLITTTSADRPAPTCAGDEYTLQPGDDCRSVSRSQGIGTDLLLTDNGLAAFCRDFPKQGKLCLANKCETHTVVEGDSCKAIAREYGMSEAQLRAWNPSIDAGCYNLKDMVGYQLCVNKPGEPYASPAPTTLAPIPTEVADGTNRRCGRFYKVAAGDYCNLICLRFGISLYDFIFLNPTINGNCTNLYADLSYCVQAVGDINTYSGRPGYVTYTFGVTRTVPLGDPATGLPDVAWSSPTATTTRKPLVSGSRGDCNSYLNGDNFQKDVSNSDLKSNCDLAARVYGVSLEDLGIWNPALGDASDASCAFEPGVRYCAKYYEGDKPAASDDGPDGMAENCVETVDVDETGTPTCQEILDMYELTIAQFYAWNPSVGPECGGMWAGYQYCVQVKGGEQTQSSTTTLPASTTTTTSASPGPTTGPIKAPEPNQPGNAVASCNKYAQAQAGDWCAKFAERNGIRTEDLYAWNKALGAKGENCDNAFWASYWYCVGVTS